MSGGIALGKGWCCILWDIIGIRMLISMYAINKQYDLIYVWKTVVMLVYCSSCHSIYGRTCFASSAFNMLQLMPNYEALCKIPLGTHPLINTFQFILTTANINDIVRNILLHFKSMMMSKKYKLMEQWIEHRPYQLFITSPCINTDGRMKGSSVIGDQL